MLLVVRYIFLSTLGSTGRVRRTERLTASACPAAAFFTSYEFLKGRLPVLFPRLGTEEFAPALHMLSASGGEVVRSLLSPGPSTRIASLFRAIPTADGLPDTCSDRGSEATKSDCFQGDTELGCSQGSVGNDRAARLLPRVRDDCGS